MTSPFKSFKVLPAYGSRQAAITYELKPGMEGDVYFYRSLNGALGWELLNPDAPISASEGDFLDTTVPSDDKLAAVHWRGMLEVSSSVRYGGEPVTAYEAISRSQYATVRKILINEEKGMCPHLKGSGVKIYHCIPKEFGAPADSVDQETGQKLSPDCPDSEDYGGDYEGGWHTPLKTWVHVLQMGDETEKDREEGDGVEREAPLALRMLPYPKPRRGHMIVFPDSDMRYVVDEVTKRFFFRGIVPVAWHVTVSLLRRSDPRYRLPME